MTYWLWSISREAFPATVRANTFALRRQGRRRLAEVRAGDRIFAYLPGSRVLAGMFEATGSAFEDATALAPGLHAPHRVRVRPLVVLPEEAWVAYDGFAAHLRVLDDYRELPTPEARFRAVVQRVLHALPALDGKVLEFVVRARAGADPEALMDAVEAVREASRTAVPPAPEPAPAVIAEAPTLYDPSTFDRAAATERLIAAVEARGFVYEPFEVAAYVTALRTKPFVLLAGPTGVGKSRLPALVAEATGGVPHLVPVRPDWTDPAETLGYTDLSGRFRPGALLRVAREAGDHPGRHHTLVLDELNLGRPEHFLAEVLSRMEAREATPDGYVSPPLLTERLGAADVVWQGVRVPANLGLVGTVNVDESAHAFSAKVLDRAFVLTLAATDLGSWTATAETADAPSEAWPSEAWPSEAWRPRALRLGALGDLSSDEQAEVERAVAAIAEVARLLGPAGLGPGYRTRDEVALFALHAVGTPGAFRTRDGQTVDPLDVALTAKILPR
ncbi:MAG TPA: AAA family ATPase, partial [Rubricoccaceae bacterium]